MNPSSSETGELRLPPPVSEQAPPAENGEQGVAGYTAEQAPSAPERAPSAPQAVAAGWPTVPLPEPPVMQVAVPTDDVSGTTQSVSLPVADDRDLIEKEWVHKAKQIVERTRDDPYQQSVDLTGVKADYMKKRYNKTIKLST